ncbi:MAG: type IV pilin protein [Gammaproteobacteria bacterium]|nr:type IV pilin protein [Gammaproteobacteria bacterium]
MTKHSKGFTLIELMIVVAIIGILTTIAMGWFGDNVIASNRTEARKALSETAGSLEKCKSLYGAYDDGNCTVALGVATENNYYTITGTSLLPSSFTLTATPVAGEPQANDADCTTLTLTNTGVKGGTPAAANECW